MQVSRENWLKNLAALLAAVVGTKFAEQIRVALKNLFDSVMWYDEAAGGLTTEQVDDRVATLLVAGNNINLTYVDLSDSLTIDVEPLGTVDISDLAVVVKSYTLDEFADPVAPLNLNQQPVSGFNLALGAPAVPVDGDMWRV
jgi:hypothetical protein